MTDWELLDRYNRQGATDALCELMQRHIAMVHAAALREVRDPHLADEITQAAFLVLMRRAKTLSPRIPLGGWLFKVTRYAAADLRKKESRRQRHEREAGQMRLENPAPQTPDATWSDIAPHLNDAIAQLAAADRSAVIMRYLEGRSVEEIAQSLGASENTTRQRLSRALQRLRKHLTKKGVTVGAAALGVTLEQSAAHAASSAAVVPAALLQSVTALISGGVVPSASALSLVTGVLTAMRNAKLFLAAGVSAAALVLGTTAYFAATALAADEKPPAALAPPVAAGLDRGAGAQILATQPTTAPAVAKFGPAKTPKATVVAAYQAALVGDEDGMISCFDSLTDAQKTTLRQVVETMCAVHGVGKAVGDKFGAEAVKEFNQVAPLGVDPAEIEKGKEFLDGEHAVVDIGQAGPGKIDMVKVDDLWKISATTMATLNADNVAQSAKMVPILKTLAADIKAGKYASFDDLKQDLMKIMSSQ